MIFSGLLSKEGVVGVDVGSSSIKIVYAEPTRQGAHISNVTICPTPLNSIREGVVTDVKEVAGAIQFAMRSAGIKASAALAAIAGPGVIVRHVKMPKMTEAALRKTIYFEASKYISASVDESVVEFEIVGDAEDEQMDVILVAAPRAMVESKVATLEEAGLEPLAVDVEAFAVLRALVEQNPDFSIMEKNIAILDMGASHTEINLVSKGSLALSRNIPIAGSSLTNAIKNVKNCTDDEAEQVKYAVDLSEILKADGVTEDPVLRVVQPLVDELLREIRRSINYYQSQLPDGSPEMSFDELVLTGGTSRLKGLGAYTTSRLNVPVTIGNPALSRMIDTSVYPTELSAEDIPLLTVAFGLAIKEIAPAALKNAA
ncbi:MAG: type IV pilus assembly protein PilM [Armatimonadetes bacterium]|nr:type IV pilus assembly protein PilM [Armatimonadota bacterium]